MKVYRLSRFSKILLLVLGIPMSFILPSFLLIAPFILKDINSIGSGYAVFGPLAILFFAFGVACIFAFKTRLIIDDISLEIRQLFNNGRILLTEVKGFHIGQNYIYVESIETTKRKLRIDRNIEKQDEIIEFLHERFPDLDELEH